MQSRKTRSNKNKKDRICNRMDLKMGTQTSFANVCTRARICEIIPRGTVSVTNIKLYLVFASSRWLAGAPIKKARCSTCPDYAKDAIIITVETEMYGALSYSKAE
jgi:hypothetical protein